MKPNYQWLIFAATNILLLALVAMVNDGLAGWSLTLFIAGPCVIWPALRLPPAELLGCLILSGLAADAQLPTPPGLVMSLFIVGAGIILIIRPWLGQIRRVQQIGLAWLLNALYFASFTVWALARNQAGGAAFWEHVAVDFCLSQILFFPVALWHFDFPNCAPSLAGLAARPRRVRGRILNPQMAFYQRLNPRLFVLSGVLALLFLILAGGLAWQQLWKASSYAQLEQRQTRRRILQPGARGKILDRNGVPLVVNQPHYSVVLYVDELRKEFSEEFIKLKKEWQAQAQDDTTEARPTIDSNKLMWTARFNVVRRYLDQANTLLGRPPQPLDEKTLTLHIQQKPLLPFPLISSINEEEFARFNEEVSVASHMQTRVEAWRAYPYGSLAFHTLGWVGLTNDYDEEDWQVDNLPTHSTFALRGMTGLSGLELLADNTLSGKSGGEIWTVDPANARINRIEQKAPEPGQDFICSLDVNIQRVAEAELVKDHKDILGSVAVIDVRTGEVLALASKPDFDLNGTVPSMSYALSQTINDSEEGWYNRATQVSYPPGSMFKVVDCIAGMRAGILNATTTYECPGGIMVGNHLFSDHDYPEGLGTIGMVYALYMSSDVFFYKAGLDIGHDRIYEQATKLGLGQKTGIEIPEAPLSRLIVPDEAWRKAHHMSPWNDGDTVNMAIGQGDLLVTPLQMACLAASIARDETRTKPTLIHNPSLSPNAVTQKSEPLGLNAEQRALLLDGMEKAASIGTARIVNTLLPGVRVAGKTGTAQWTKNGKKLTVAWFMCFAPIDNPRVAVAMAVESTPGHEYYGGPTCGPYVAEILREYFKRYPTGNNN